MKKLVLISVLVLIIVFPSVVFAGSAYWNAKATFWNDSSTLPNARGTATITYNKIGTWTISVNITNLLKNHEYIFNISLEDQLMVKADYPITSDSRGKLSKTFTTSDVVTILGQDTYSIVRLLDMSGESGGIILSDVELTTETNPYLPGNPFATMVMRAREDGYGSLVFSQPRK